MIGFVVPGLENDVVRLPASFQFVAFDAFARSRQPDGIVLLKRIADVDHANRDVQFAAVRFHLHGLPRPIGVAPIHIQMQEGKIKTVDRAEDFQPGLVSGGIGRQ